MRCGGPGWSSFSVPRSRVTARASARLVCTYASPGQSWEGSPVPVRRWHGTQPLRRAAPARRRGHASRTARQALRLRRRTPAVAQAVWGIPHERALYNATRCAPTLVLSGFGAQRGGASSAAAILEGEATESTEGIRRWTARTVPSRRTSLGYRTFRCRACTRTFYERTGTPFNRLEYPTDVVLLVVRLRLQYSLSLRSLATRRRGSAAPSTSCGTTSAHGRR